MPIHEADDARVVKSYSVEIRYGLLRAREEYVCKDKITAFVCGTGFAREYLGNGLVKFMLFGQFLSMEKQSGI